MTSFIFICTGNFYRSRFAEAYFNFLSDKFQLPAFAKSAGFKPHLADDKAAVEGEISLLAKNKLDTMGISKVYYDKKRELLEENMLKEADFIIVLDKDEHFSMMKELFPKYLEKSIFYDAKDIEFCDHNIALNYIKKMIENEIYKIFTNNQS